MGRATEHVLATGIGRWLHSNVAPGACVFDVGANVGDYSALAAALAGPDGRVYAFEPAPINVATLRARFPSGSRVEIVEAAVGESSRNVRLYLDADNPTQHSLGSHNVGRAGGALKVRQVALDDFPARRAPDVIKIDAQGCELRVIRGAERLLSGRRPLVVLELWPYGLRNLRGDARQLLDALRHMDYELFKLSAEGLLRPEPLIADFLSRDERWAHINVAALPAELADQRRATERARQLTRSDSIRATAFSGRTGWLVPGSSGTAAPWKFSFVKAIASAVGPTRTLAIRLRQLRLFGRLRRLG
jgi:FkbM family methyltransferase